MQEGQLVTPGTPLFQLIESGKLEIKTDLSPSNINKLKQASQLKFVAGKRQLPIQLRSIVQIVDERTRTQEVRFSLPPNTALAAGLPGRIVWQSKEQRLPSEYILRRKNQLGFMIAKDIVEGLGKAHFQPLPNAIEGQPAVVNLPDDTQVIILNRYRVTDGQQIKLP